MMKKLTPKQKKFVDEYLIDLNATQAAIRAGYSKKTASRQAIELLQKTHVAKAVQKKQLKLQEKTEVTQERVIEELAKIGFTDIKNFLTFRTELTLEGKDKKGNPIYNYAHIVHLKDSNEVDGSIISEIQLKDGQLKFKLHDKVKALEDLARHLGLFNDKLTIKGKVEHEHTHYKFKGFTKEQLQVKAKEIAQRAEAIANGRPGA